MSLSCFLSFPAGENQGAKKPQTARRGEARVGGSLALPGHGLLSLASPALSLNYTPDLVGFVLGTPGAAGTESKICVFVIIYFWRTCLLLTLNITVLDINTI